MTDKRDTTESEVNVQTEQVAQEAGEETVTAASASADAAKVKGALAEVAAENAALKETLAAVEAERDQLKDQLLRHRAEFDNYRKRTARQSEENRKRAAEGLMRALLPVLDNLGLALSHAEDTSNGFADGVKMVFSQLGDVLTANGLEPIAALGEAFDPNVHEALSHLPSTEYAADTVMEEYQRGYRMGDYIVRPAKVVVSSGAPESAADTAEDVASEEAAEQATSQSEDTQD